MPPFFEIIGYSLMIVAYTFDLIKNFGILNYIIVIIIAITVYYFRRIKINFSEPNKKLTDFSANALIEIAFKNLKSSKPENKIDGFLQLKELYVHNYDKVFRGLIDALANEKNEDSRSFIRQCILHIYEKK